MYSFHFSKLYVWREEYFEYVHLEKLWLRMNSLLCVYFFYFCACIFASVRMYLYFICICDNVFTASQKQVQNYLRMKYHIVSSVAISLPGHESTAGCHGNHDSVAWKQSHHHDRQCQHKLPHVAVHHFWSTKRPARDDNNVNLSNCKKQEQINFIDPRDISNIS